MAKGNVVAFDGRGWMTGLSFRTNDDGKMVGSSLHNAVLYLENHPDLKGLYWYDEFADQIFVDRALIGAGSGDYPRPLQDHDETAMAAWLNARGLAPSISNTAAAIRHVAFMNPRNALREWADGLVWDRKSRIDQWLTYYAGADDSELTRVLGRRFLVSAMARLLNPGCKVDTMLILEGPQGLKKSTLIEVLAGKEWFSDQVGDVTSKDASQMIQGIWIMEVAEMDAFSRPEANAVKKFLSRLFDRYRPPYGRNVIRRERRCVFFGTINPDGSGYLKDTTGNRRYWPVGVSSIDVDGVRADREQLWAEAKHAFEAGEKWWIDNDDDIAQAVAAEQDARRDDDVWEPRVRAWLDAAERQLKPWFTSSEVLWEVLSVPLKEQRQSEKIRIAKILKLMGCRDVNNRNGIHGRSWEIDR